MDFKVFINRPVLAWVISLFIITIGWITYNRLSVQQYPALDIAYISVSTVYPGASASTIESLITTPLETEIAKVADIDYMSSSSQFSSSTILITLKLGADSTASLADIQSRVSSVGYKLPANAYTPAVILQDPNSNPVMFLKLSSEKHTTAYLSDYFARNLQSSFNIIPGVSSATNYSSDNLAMRIWLNPYRMMAKSVSASDVMAALATENVYMPTGSIRTGTQLYNINLSNDLRDADQFGDIVIKHVGDGMVRIRDIADTGIGSENNYIKINMDGKQGVPIAIIPTATANIIQVAADVRAQVEALQSSLPEGIEFSVNYDSSTFIKQSIDEVGHTILITTFFVIMVMLVCIGSLRIVIIPAIAIPVSLVGSLALMSLFGFSINTFTLLALVLAIGMVVDDAIVVAENMYRHLEDGMAPKKAALICIDEIKLTIISMTFTLAAVYAPVGLMNSLQGILFKEFTFTLAGAVIISGLVALTLSPMLCSKVLTKSILNGRFVKLAEQVFETLVSRYQRILTTVLNHGSLRLLVCTAAVLIMFVGIPTIGAKLHSEIVPTEDAGAVFVRIQAPSNANEDYVSKVGEQVIAAYEQNPDMVSYGIVSGVPMANLALSWGVLKPWSERTVSATEIIEQLRQRFEGITEAIVIPLNPFKIPGVQSQLPIQFIVKTSGSYEELYHVMEAIQEKAQAFPGMSMVSTDIKFDNQEIVVTSHRDKQSTLGLTTTSIGNALLNAYGEPTSNEFINNSYGYYVIPQLAEEYNHDPANLRSLLVQSINGRYFPLYQVADIELQRTNRQFSHFQGLRSATLSGIFTADSSLGEALDYLTAEAQPLLKPGMYIDYAGISRTMQEVSHDYVIFLYAMIFIYLVLAALYESFVDPIVILLSVPLSIFGALFALWVLSLSAASGGTLNLYTQIGLLTLIGLISKHGIMIVDFTKQNMARGMEAMPAIIDAAAVRFRPIMLTTLAMVLGVVPLALASGAGENARHQLGWVIMAGMSFGTVMTLFVIPVLLALSYRLRAGLKLGRG